MSAMITTQDAPLVASNPMDQSVEVFQAGLDRRKQNRDALMAWVKVSLVEGSDYGRIHTTSKSKCLLAGQGRVSECTTAAHWSKPVLFKPGAEKICGMLGVTVHFPTLPEYERAAYSGVDIRNIILRCELRDASGRVVAEGCGARSVEKDYGDLNKAIKMTEKSSAIDATLRMAGLSEVFTQDEESILHAAEQQEALAPKPILTPIPAPPKPDTVSAAQVKRLEARITAAGLDRDKVKGWLSAATKGRVHHFREMTKVMYDKLDLKIDAWASDDKTPAAGEQVSDYYAAAEDFLAILAGAEENANDKSQEFIASLRARFAKQGMGMSLSKKQYDYLENLVQS